MRRIHSILLMVTLLLGLSGPSYAQMVEAFPLPSIPMTLRNPLQRAGYLLEHYWEGCDFNNKPLFSEGNALLEQRFVDFLSVFPHADGAALKTGVKQLMTLASVDKDAYKRVMALAEKYLYEPNSPLLNEEHYLLFLNEITTGVVLSEIEKIRPRHQLKAANRNRPGSRATDFPFVRAEGGTTTLYEAAGKQETVLFFYDPDCGHCAKIINRVIQDEELAHKVADGETIVIAICIEGSKENWLRHRPALPQTWKVGYAPELFQNDNLYSIRAIPTFYILDREQRVVIKDAK